MKANNGLLVLGLFTIAGVVTVSCGGSDSNDENPGSAGTSSTSAGTSSTSAGTTSKAGTTGSSAGTTNNTGGSATNNGGTGTNGGRNTNNGGAPDFPGFGGAFEVAACPSGTKTGGACTPAQGAQNACQLNDTTYCGCQNDSTWLCIDTGDFGGGGQGPTFGQATCPDNAKSGDACTGLGLCANPATCACYMSKVICQ